MIEIAFRPDRASDVAVHRQLAEHLAALIATGRLAGGAKLPASRELAFALGIARNTVTQAYEQLVVQGRLRAHVGQGTFVAQHGALATPPEAEHQPPARSPGTDSSRGVRAACGCPAGA